MHTDSNINIWALIFICNEAILVPFWNYARGLSVKKKNRASGHMVNCGWSYKYCFNTNNETIMYG